MREITFVIADDAMFMRTVLKKMIESREGYTVIGEAADGLQAIEQVKLKKPDIITLDITMPNMTGINAIEHIQKESPNTRIIMVSAMGQKSMVMEAIIKGAMDFVVKPFETSRVMEAVQNVMSK